MQACRPGRRVIAPKLDHMHDYRIGKGMVTADMPGKVVSDVVYGVLNH